MASKFKALGLALFAALALSVAVAPAASAVPHTFQSNATPENPVHLTAEEKRDGTTENEHEEKFAGAQDFRATPGDTNTIRCTNLEAEATVNAESVEQVTFAKPQYTECWVVETVEGEEGPTKTGSPATVINTGCDFTFKGETTPTTGEGSTSGEHATVGIECAEGEPIEVRVTGLKLKCIDIDTQSLHAAKYFNGKTGVGEEEVKDVSLHATTNNIVSTTTGACGEGTHEGGTYTGEVTVTGFSDTEHKNRTNISVSGAGET